MKVSTIIPAYRAAKTIGRAVDSLLSQVRPPDEIVVVDDGSPDNLPDALAAYGNRVRLIRQPNGGAASARNRGIEAAEGDLIAFLDADDYWEPTKLQRQLAVLEEHPEVGLVASRYYQQMPGEPRTECRPEADAMLDRVLRLAGDGAFAMAMRIWTTTVLVRRSVLGEHRFCSGLEPAEDRDLWVRLITAAPLYKLSQPLATYVLEPGSLSRSNVDRDCGNMLRVVHRNGPLLGRRQLRRWEVHVYRRWAAGHLSADRPRAALKPAWERLKRQPFSAEGWWILLKSATQAWTVRAGQV
jgi:glycosyltransferase involved in cell wall biosynthesis